MARVMKETVDHYVCDACGRDFYERKECSLVFRANDEITFEWWTRGDYCGECHAMLANAICRSFPVAERYDPDETKIPKEIALIEAERLRGEGVRR